MKKIHKSDRLLLITPLFPPYVGGAERRISELVYAIRQLTDNIDVLSYDIYISRPKIPSFQEEKLKNVRIFRVVIKNKWIGDYFLFRSFYSPLYLWFCCFTSLLFMLIKRPKYVFVSVPPFPFGFSVALACKILRKRLILDLHDIPVLKGFRESLRFIPTLSVAKLVLAVYNTFKKKISPIKRPSLVKVIPHGINSEMIRRAKKSSRSPTAVLVGGASLEWYYEPEFLVKTASVLKDMNSDIKIKIIGASNSLKKSLSKLIKKYNLTDRVTVCSPRPIEELYDMLLQSSVGIVEFSKKFKTLYEYASLITIPTKVADYLGCGLSLAYRGPKGPLARFIAKNSIGAIIDTTSPNAFASCINDAFQQRQSNPRHFNKFSEKFLLDYDLTTLFTRFLQTIFIKDESV